jgi:hypothetical protein
VLCAYPPQVGMSSTLEYAVFSPNRAGLRSLVRWGKRFPERCWAVEGAGGLGRSVALRLVAAGEGRGRTRQVRFPSPSSRHGQYPQERPGGCLSRCPGRLRDERLADVGQEEHCEILRMLPKDERTSSRSAPSTAYMHCLEISLRAELRRTSQRRRPLVCCAACA